MPRAARVSARIAAALLFVVLATANSGGYRFGVSDQAFYAPAIALSLDSSLFPLDRAVLLPQMKLWLGGPLLVTMTRAVGGDMATAFALIYLITLVLLGWAAVSFVRSLGGDRVTAAACLALLTIRHQIARTGANSLEGYMHPRMLAFACGLAGLAAIVRNRSGLAAVWVIAALMVHTTTGLWFTGVLALAVWWRVASQRWRWSVPVGVATLGVTVIGVGMTGHWLTVMDEDWRRVLDTKAYLFPAEWPAYAWGANLSYALVIGAIYRRRRRLGMRQPGEPALVVGLLGLVAGFLVAVPLTAYGLALAIQLQVNRVFWVLDAVAVCYLGWWLLGDLGQRWRASLRATAVGALVVVSAARGYYVIAIEADRQLVQAHLPVTPWTDAMQWLRVQPGRWHVLANPEHSLVFGPSIRVAAERDTLLDLGKDSAMAMYDRSVAMRVAERTAALSRFAQFTTEDVRSLAARYDLDVFVDAAERQFEFPVLYRNDQFVIYRLR